MKNTVATFAQAKAEGRKLAMLTAYDYSTAKLEDEAGIDGILIGDSLGNVVLGYEDTLSVTVEDMIHHSAAVARGAKNALIVCDMPFLSYEVSVPDAVRNAGRLLKEGRRELREAGRRRRGVPTGCRDGGRRHPRHGAPGSDAAVHQRVRRLQGAGQKRGRCPQADLRREGA